MAAFAGAVTLKGRRGWTGVPNAGEDDGIEESGCCCAARPLGAKNGGGLALFFSGLCPFGFCPFLRGLCTRFMSTIIFVLLGCPCESNYYSRVSCGRDAVSVGNCQVNIKNDQVGHVLYEVGSQKPR